MRAKSDRKGGREGVMIGRGWEEGDRRERKEEAGDTVELGRV